MQTREEDKWEMMVGYREELMNRIREFKSVLTQGIETIGIKKFKNLSVYTSSALLTIVFEENKNDITSTLLKSNRHIKPMRSTYVS